MQIPTQAALERPAAGKVLGFDSWTGGVQNYERIARAFEASGHEFAVVHIGSWGGDPGHPVQERIGDTTYRDIRFHGTNNLGRVLDAERPDAVVFLSTDTFAHRAFIRRCRARGIPTLNLYHGLVTVQDTAVARMYKVNPLAQARFVLERIPKALRYIWPAYVSSLLATRATATDWWRFVSDIFVMASGRRPTTAAPDARTDRCCVYVEADVGHAMRRYGFAREQVVPIGNPDLARFGLDAQTVGSRVATAGDSDEVMYIDTGLVYTGFVFESQAQYRQHLIDTRDALARQGRRLVLKPHPDHLRTTMLDELRAAGVEVCSNADFVPRLRRCVASIVEPSSASIVPALMGMPLLLAQFGPLAGQRYGAVLTSYPRHRELQSIDDFSRLLAEERESLDANATQAWIERNAGPLPAERMPERVVQVVRELIERAHPKSVRPGASAAHAPGRS